MQMTFLRWFRVEGGRDIVHVFDKKTKEAPLSGFAMLSRGVCSSSVVTLFYTPFFG